MYLFSYTCILHESIQLLKAMYGYLLTVILTRQLLTFQAVDKVCLHTVYNVDSVK